MSTRADLIRKLRDYQPLDEHEELMRRQILAFVEAHDDCFERSLSVGHVTGSAWVIDDARRKTLLVHHARLNKWLQPGGHADGNPDVLAVAMREAEEETGLPVTPLSLAIFDVDAHDIPARKSDPAHIHYDIRYLLQADSSLIPQVSAESRDVAWVDLSRVSELNTDESVLRLVRKTMR
jgi:8-oxo-dGTP pyrophosphatase MutT (NUDIX family)